MRKYIRLKLIRFRLKLYKIYFLKKNFKKYGQNKRTISKKFSQFMSRFKGHLTVNLSFQNIKLSLIGGKYWRSTYYYDKFFYKKQSLDLQEIFFFKRKYKYHQKSNEYVLLKFFSLYSKYFLVLINKIKFTKNIKILVLKLITKTLIKKKKKGLVFLVFSKLIIILF